MGWIQEWKLARIKKKLAEKESDLAFVESIAARPMNPDGSYSVTRAERERFAKLG